MVTQQIKTANRNSETNIWEEGPTITLVPAQVIGVGESDGHAIIYTASQDFFVWPDKQTVDNFLQNA